MSDADRITIGPEQVAALDRALRERQETIRRDRPQVPDYPPLPQCPECHGTTSAVQWTKNLHDVTLIDFAPCGHGFQLDWVRALVVDI